MEIPAGARKCPYCHNWQYRLSIIVVHPLFSIVLMLVMLAAFGAVMGMFQREIFRKGEPFRNYADQITIVESKMEFGTEQDEQGRPIVAIVGKMKNASPVDWKDVHLQVDFFDSKGELIDAGQENWRSPFLPANEEIGFKISFTRQFPEDQYAKHKIRVVYAIDNRQRF